MVGLLTSWWRRRRSVGARGERTAARFLQAQGYRLVRRNLHLGPGEIDLLVLAPPPQGHVLVVVEVKARLLGPDEAPALPPEVRVNPAKQRKLVTLAQRILRQKRWAACTVRFDVIGVDFPRQGPPVVRHHPGAFTSPW